MEVIIHFNFIAITFYRNSKMTQQTHKIIYCFGRQKLFVTAKNLRIVQHSNKFTLNNKFYIESLNKMFPEF